MAKWDTYSQLTTLIGNLEFLVRDSGAASPEIQIQRLIGMAFLTQSISPAQITADQNDYSPTGLTSASVLRLSTDAIRNITGLTGGIKDRMLAILNIGSNNIVLKNASSSSTAANRFALDADQTLSAGQGCILWYDIIAGRWACIAKVGGGGTAGGDLSGTYPNPIVTQASGTFALPSDNTGSPNTTTGTQNDVTTTNLSVFGWNGASDSTINGFANGTDGRLLIVYNMTTAKNLILANEDAGSTAANRITTANQTPFLIAPRAFAILVYNATSGRWAAGAQWDIPEESITASANAATLSNAFKRHKVTNNSAAALTITIPTSGAVDGQMHLIRVYDFSAVSQTITWVNTENSTITAPIASNGSTTLPITSGFQYNAATSKWRCIGKS